MKQLTINLPENQYPAFLEMMKTMDYITINTNDWFDNLSLSQKKSIQKGIEAIENGRFYSHETVMEMAKMRIQELKSNQ